MIREGSENICFGELTKIFIKNSIHLIKCLYSPHYKDKQHCSRKVRKQRIEREMGKPTFQE